jgi:guanylate kinase
LSEANGKGLLVVLSAPSGGGKSTVIRRILAKGNPLFRYSVSMTTRPKRPGETEGKDYFYVSEDEFAAARVQDDLVEFEQVHGFWYGTPKKKLQEWVAQGFVIFLDLDVHGALAIKKHFPVESLIIFLKPPDVATLVQRLTQRRTETEQQIEKRLQRIPEEMALADKFDHVVVNDHLEQAISSVEKLVYEKLGK